MCLYPRLIKNPKYRSNKKNGGQVPAVNDIRVTTVPIGCGNCIECRKQKAREWQVRLLEEVRENRNGHFVTLTFSNENIKKLYEDKLNEGLKAYELDNNTAAIATRRFLERWRKKYKKSVRHWLVTELGHNGTENIHLHGIIWTDKTPNEIRGIWQYGHVWAGYENKRTYVNEQTVNYIIKYVTKQDQDHKYYKTKILTSAGIGGNYINRLAVKKNKYKEKETDETYKTRSGHKMSMPIYYRNKIYTEEEKEKLWIEKLNKEERWVLGQKIDISKDDKEYKKMLEYAQQENERRGYKGTKTNWDAKKYEEQRRETLQNKRRGI